MFDTLKQDLRYSLRGLLARPGFALAAILTLALGIGANTAIFSVINGLLLKPLPYPDSERLVQVHNVYPTMGIDNAGTSVPDYFDRREQAEALEDLAIYTGISLNLASDGTPQRLLGLRASASLFSTLQTGAVLGRVFDESNEVPGNDKVAVLGHDLWRSQFASDPDIIGRDVRLNGESFRIIGVMPQGFMFPNRETQIWLPFAFTEHMKSDRERGREYSESIGRLAPGATTEQLEEQMRAIILRNADRLASTGGPDAQDIAEFFRQGGMAGRARALRDRWVGDVRPVLWLLQGVVLFVLLIACANVANLMLTRVASRHKELSVRTALGASRGRIVRQLLIEAVVLALAGAAVGIGVAWLGLRLLDMIDLTQGPMRQSIGLDGTVLLFTLLVSVLTGLVFGLVPAFGQSAGRPYEVLKESGRGNTGSRAARATRNALVMVQIALCVTLLVAAGLLVKSFNRLQNEDPGFRRDGLITLRLDLPPARYPDNASIVRFYEDVLRELRSLPGVTYASYTNTLPFGASVWQSSYDVEGQDLPTGAANPHGYLRVADETYFQAMEISLLAGRTFTSADHAGAERVTVVDELLAKKHFPDGAIGHRIRIAGDGDYWWTIVGVVGAVKHSDLAGEVTKESYYFPFRQHHHVGSTERGGYLVIRTDLAAGGLIQPIREAVLRVDPEQPVYDIRSLDERIAVSLQSRRAPMLLLVLFAGVALVLAAVGIYGVLGYAVTQRTGELGVRMAIGAQRSDVLRLVLLQGGRIALAGILAGLAGALALGGFLGSQLYGVSRFDPWTFLTVIVVLGAVAMLACWLPARRASRVDPIVALRYE